MVLTLAVCPGALLATDIPLLKIAGVNWTETEVSLIEKLHDQGTISIATKVGPSVYMPNADGSISGFHFNVLREFTELADIKIEVVVVTWNDYFFKEGENLEEVKSNASYSYTPTLLENVDLYLDGITALDWREKMFNIIKFVPTRQLIVSRKDNLPKNKSDIDNKVFSMVSNTSMEQNLEIIKKQNGLTLSYLYTDNFDNMDRLVSEGRADFTVFDGDRAFTAVSNHPNLTIAWPISEPQIMGWAIHKDKVTLKSILDKYITYAGNNGILDEHWHNSYGVTFTEYLSILKLE